MKHSILLLALLAAGCAGAPLRRDDGRDQEIQALKARIVQLQQEAAMNQVELAQLRQRVAELEARPGNAPRSASAPVTTAPARPREPAPRQPVPEVRREPARTTAVPPTSAPSARREPLPAVPEEEIVEVDIPLPDDQPQPPPVRPSPPAASRPAPSAPAPSSPAPAAPAEPVPGGPASQVLYDRGYALYHQGHFVDAEASFQRYLQGNPTGDLADNAQYWIGECRYARNDFRNALAAFREVVERFPKGNKVADAMLKSGQCLEGMGDVEGARVTYREVARRFPGTAAASAAEERRAKLP
jgi:tol-pal system protein YbgF